MKIISTIFLGLLFILISACNSPSVEQDKMPKEVQPKVLKEKHSLTSPPSVIAIKTVKQSWQQVTVKHLDFEGGFYGLVSENGVRLLPRGLPKEYKIEGTILRVKGHFLTDMMTIQQWGKVFKIVEVELIKMGTGNKSLN